MSKASRGSDGKRVSAALRMGAAELLGREASRQRQKSARMGVVRVTLREMHRPPQARSRYFPHAAAHKMLEYSI